MTLNDYLLGATEKLVQAGVGTARLDVLVLLEDILGTNRAQLLAHLEMEIAPAQVQVLDKMVARRVEHEPLAYIRGKIEFYGREFIVTPAVLVPRPESETMIDLLKRLVGQDGIGIGSLPENGSESPKSGPDSSLRWNDAGAEGRRKAAGFDKNPKKSEISENKRLTSKVFSGLVIGDVGAGSGALGITAALELPGSRVELLEIDLAALLVARRNVAKYKLEMTVSPSDLLAGSKLDFDVLLCNLPYVPDAHTINQAAMSEPKLAIFGGADGLDLYRSLFEQITVRDTKPRLILTESLPPQHADLAALAAQFGYEQLAEDDFIQTFAPVKLSADSLSS